MGYYLLTLTVTCFVLGSNCSITILASLPRTNVLMMGGTLVPRTPRWYTFSVTTDSPEAKDTKQILTP